MNDYIKLLVRHKSLVLFLPVIAGFSLLTLLNFYYRKLYYGDLEMIKSYIVPNFHLIVSLMSSWWLLLVYSEFISEKGNEVFYMYFSLKSMIGCQLLLQAVYAALVGIYFSLCYNKFGLSPFFLFLLIGESLFVSGITFLLIQLTKNTSVSIGVVAIYCIYLIKFDEINALEKVSIFTKEDAFSNANVKQLLIDLGFAFAFYIIGVVCYKRRKVYY